MSKPLILELKEGRSIFLKLNTPFTTTEDTAKIPLVTDEINDKLIYSDNKITIGAGVKRVRINAKATIGWNSTEGSYKLTLRKNGAIILRDSNNKVASRFASVSIVGWIEDVVEGDVIELYMSKDSGTMYIPNSPADGTAYMSIDIVG